MNLLFLGPPASGKGTQAKILARTYGFTHLNTGDIFRQALANQTPLGIKAHDEYWGRGRLVPDEITNGLAAEQLQKINHHFILDGYPRTIGQAQALGVFLQTSPHTIDYIVHFQCSDQTIITRAAARQTCTGCGEIYGLARPPTTQSCDFCQGTLKVRSDDQPHLMPARLEEYHHKTAPLLEYYSQRYPLVTIDAEGTIDHVLLQIRHITKN